MSMGCYCKFFRSSNQASTSRLEEAAARIAEETGESQPRRTRQRSQPTERDFLNYIMEFVAKIGFYPNQFTMGEVIDMLQIRMEEQQIGWACSAQNPDLLPESVRKKKRGTT